jgi:hypothetical protein
VQEQTIKLDLRGISVEWSLSISTVSNENSSIYIENQNQSIEVATTTQWKIKFKAVAKAVLALLSLRWLVKSKPKVWKRSKKKSIKLKKVGTDLKNSDLEVLEINISNQFKKTAWATLLYNESFPTINQFLYDWIDQEVLKIKAFSLLQITWSLVF